MLNFALSKQFKSIFIMKFQVINSEGKQMFADNSMSVAFDWAFRQKDNEGWFLLNAKGEKVIKF